MNEKTKEIKIRNLTRVLTELEEGTMTPLRWENQDRDWYDGEREELVDELQKTIAAIARS